MSCIHLEYLYLKEKIMPIQLTSANLQTLSEFPNIKFNIDNLSTVTNLIIKIISISTNENIGFVNLDLLSNLSVIGKGAYSFDNSNTENIDSQIYAFLKTLPEFTGAIDC